MSSVKSYHRKIFSLLLVCFVLPQLITSALYIILFVTVNDKDAQTQLTALLCAVLINVALAAASAFSAFKMSGFIAKPTVKLIEEFDAVFTDNERYALEKSAQGIRYRLLVNNIKYFREKRLENNQIKQKLDEVTAALSCTNDITWRVISGSDSFQLNIPEYWYGNYPKFFLNKSAFLYEYIHDDDIIKFNNAMTRVCAVAERSFALKLQLKISSEQYIWTIIKGASILSDEGIVVVGSIIDIQQKLKMEDEIRQNYMMYKFALNAVSDILYEVDVKKDEFVISDISKWYEIFDVQLDGNRFDTERRGYWLKIHPDYREAFVDRFLCYDHLLVLPNHSQTYEYRVLNKFGDWIWLSHTVTAVATEDGHVTRAIGQMVDINMKKRRELKEIYQSAHDSLTGTFSYSAIHREFAAHIAKFQEATFVVININKFHLINEIYGQTIGDLTLRHLVGIIWKSQVCECSVGRTGGDEFVMIIREPHKYTDTLEQTLKLLFSHLSEPAEIESNVINITVSVGTSVYGKDGTTYDELYAVAEERMKQFRKEQPAPVEN